MPDRSRDTKYNSCLKCGTTYPLFVKSCPKCEGNFKPTGTVKLGDLNKMSYDCCPKCGEPNANNHICDKCNQNEGFTKYGRDLFELPDSFSPPMNRYERRKQAAQKRGK